MWEMANGNKTSYLLFIYDLLWMLQIGINWIQINSIEFDYDGENHKEIKDKYELKRFQSDKQSKNIRCVNNVGAKFPE